MKDMHQLMQGYMTEKHQKQIMDMMNHTGQMMQQMSGPHNPQMEQQHSRQLSEMHNRKIQKAILFLLVTVVAFFLLQQIGSELVET